MQVKKFEAPTIQEALETIKRELGPEAIILQTKTHKRGFGLMSRSSVEVTAAVSERSLQKKQAVEKRLPDTSREAVDRMPAEKQAEFYNDYVEKHSQKPRAKPSSPRQDSALAAAVRDAQSQRRMDAESRQQLEEHSGMAARPSPTSRPARGTLRVGPQGEAYSAGEPARRTPPSAAPQARSGAASHSQQSSGLGPIHSFPAYDHYSLRGHRRG